MFKINTLKKDLSLGVALRGGILGLLLFSSLLSSYAYAVPERAIYVRSMADDIVLDDPAGTRSAFFDFCDAPHGDPSYKISTIYIASSVFGRDLLLDPRYSGALRSFISEAHGRGFKVECLETNKYWATPEDSHLGVERCAAILAFNAEAIQSGEGAGYFDGIH
ncbi:MAG: hypothetical protein ABH875_03165, partial [Candidatus Omnitrophota bacterium]